MNNSEQLEFASAQIKKNATKNGTSVSDEDAAAQAKRLSKHDLQKLVEAWLGENNVR
jgi:hypothetical protein